MEGRTTEFVQETNNRIFGSAVVINKPPSSGMQANGYITMMMMNQF